LTWLAGRWRNHQPKRAEKPHSKSARRKAGQNENPDREEHAGPASRVKNFQTPAMLKKHRWTVNKKQLESEEARPVVPGERTAESGG